MALSHVLHWLPAHLSQWLDNTPFSGCLLFFVSVTLPPITVFFGIDSQLHILHWNSYFQLASGGTQAQTVVGYTFLQHPTSPVITIANLIPGSSGTSPFICPGTHCFRPAVAKSLQPENNIGSFLHNAEEIN